MVLYICPQWLVCLFGKATSNGLWVKPSGRPSMFPGSAHMRSLPRTLCSMFSQNKLYQCDFLKKKNSQVKIRLFSCPWRVGPSPVLFLSLVPPVLQLLAHFSVSSGKPPSLYYHWGFRMLPAPSRSMPSPQVVESSLFSVTFLLQIVGALSSLRRNNSSLLTEDPKCKSEGKTNWQLPSITSMSSWYRLRANTQNRAAPLNLVMWITPSFAGWLFSAFLELNFGAFLK